MKFIKSIFFRFKDHRLVELAAQCAYYLLLSIFPFLIFLLTLFSFLPIALEFELDLIQDVVPTEIFQFIEGQWARITDQPQTGLLSFSIIFTIWTASLALDTILRLLNRAYHVTEERKFIKGRLVSIFLTIGMFGVVVVALVLQVIGGAVQEYIAVEFLNFNILRWVISFAILFLVFTLLYLLGPNIKLRVSEVYIGALFATIGWLITSTLFSLYLDNFANYTATYGTIGAVIALMVWFHLSSIIILFGGEINAELKESS